MNVNFLFKFVKENMLTFIPVLFIKQKKTRIFSTILINGLIIIKCYVDFLINISEFIKIYFIQYQITTYMEYILG